MKTNIFNAMCDDLMRIAIAPNRDELLNVFMSQGYLFCIVFHAPILYNNHIERRAQYVK